MSQEEKRLLLVDLCARAPYGVTVEIRGRYDDGERFIRESEFDCSMLGYLYDDETTIKPYLRPLSSMTEEEKETYERLKKLLVCKVVAADKGLYDVSYCVDIDEDSHEVFDWLNENHFDYRGLIPMGLALEAPEDMYNKEQSEEESEIPIPKTVDEAVKTLAKIVSKEDRDYLLENGAISMHHSLGRWIRNEWGLWTDSELKNELKKKGFEHPDDMSNYIIEEFVKYCNNKL